MFTEEGRAAAAGSLAAAWVDARLRVGDGTTMAEAALDTGFPRVEGDVVVFEATFDRDQAVGDWSVREVVHGGVVIDREAEDHGRKAEGAVWTLRAEVAVIAGTTGE